MQEAVQHLPAVNPSIFCFLYRQMSFKEEAQRKKGILIVHKNNIFSNKPFKNL